MYGQSRGSVPSGCGADGVLRKPFDLDMLSETMHRHLGAA